MKNYGITIEGNPQTGSALVLPEGATELFSTQEMLDFISNNRTLTQCKDDKIDLLKTKMQEYQDTHIKFSQSGNIYWIKSDITTQREVDSKYTHLTGSAPIIPADLDWYADYTGATPVYNITKVTTTEAKMLGLMESIGGYFQGLRQVYLASKKGIYDATTIAQVEAIDLDSIAWDSNDLGEL